MKDNLLFTGEEPFQITKHSFTIGASSTGYTLYFSVDCNSYDGAGSATWHQYSDAIPANYPLIVDDVTSGLWWKCVGNSGDVYVRC